MATMITIHDRSTPGRGKTEAALRLTCPEERLTVRELIRLRLQQEVEGYNARLVGGASDPDESGLKEHTLNGQRWQARRPLDWLSSYEQALQAFERNGFILLVDGRQVMSLDESISLRPDTRVTFLKLVPLVGG